jgi:[protein-PII] uridylyltransferase
MSSQILKRSDLPPSASLQAESEMTSFAGRVRDVHRSFIDELEKRHRAGGSGREVTQMCSAGVELIITHLFDSLLGLMKRKGRVTGLPALVALGSLGRRELAPYSDVDLLFLIPKKGARNAAVLAGYLVRMMWDSGLALSHSVRSVPELKRAMKSDIDLKTGMLDGRWICGAEELKEVLSGIKEEIRDGEDGGMLAAKIDEARQRWKKSGWSYHLVEPNVKESPGGLRDFQTIRWLGMVLPWEGTLKGLYRLAIIDREEIGDVRRAFDFLLRVRSELQFNAQCDWNVLTVDKQRSIAEELGYRSEGGFLAVELFMRDYYSNTRSIYKVLERFLEETRGRGALRIIDGTLYRRVGVKGLGQLDLQLRRRKLLADPLFAFKEQLSSGRRFSPHLESRIRNEFKQATLPAPMVRRMRESFIELLGMPGRKAPVIKGIHDLGVLGHVFPPFERLTCLKRYDLYHQYTADEHSLRAIAVLEELAERESGLLSRIYGEVAEKIELILATLLHDIGKVNMRGHASAGARMAEKLLKPFPLPAKSRSLIAFLIRNHLLLSHFSQRRDMEDRDTGMQFIKKVKSHLNLKLLYLLTYADLKATGTGIWTAWKDNLLEDLYFKASRLLAEKSDVGVSYSAVLAKRRERILAACTGESERKSMSKHLDSLPGRYIMVVSPAQAKSHLDMVERLGRLPSVINFRRLKHSLELTVCTKDRPFRLSQLCGVITINDLNILGAFAFTRKDGFVIDLFHLEGLSGGLALSRDARKKLDTDLNGILSGRIDLQHAYASHVRRWKRRAGLGIPVPCVVEFENDLSGESTIIDLTARDRPGLLYRVTRVFSEEGLDIQSAQITTLGGVAADSFYVRTTKGEKVREASAMRSIRARLVSELEGDSVR